MGEFLLDLGDLSNLESGYKGFSCIFEYIYIYMYIFTFISLLIDLFIYLFIYSYIYLYTYVCQNMALETLDHQ